MRLVIDCFKLVKGQGKSIGIYNLAKNLTRHLAETNRDQEHCEEIVVLGNEYNQKEIRKRPFYPLKFPASVSSRSGKIH